MLQNTADEQAEPAGICSRLITERSGRRGLISGMISASCFRIIVAGGVKELDQRGTLPDFQRRNPRARRRTTGSPSSERSLPVRDRSPIQVLQRAAHCRRPMLSIFRFLAHPRHFPGPAFPGEANSACRSLGRATPKRSGVLSHCRPRAKTQALCQPVASRRPAAALQALAGALSLDGVPLVPARSRGLPDPIARRLLPHPHFCPSEDSRPILHDPEQGLPRAPY